MTSTHVCPEPTCELPVPDHLFACRAHWYALPREIRNAIWQAYRDHGEGSSELLEAHGAAYVHWGNE